MDVPCQGGIMKTKFRQDTVCFILGSCRGFGVGRKSCVELNGVFFKVCSYILCVLMTYCFILQIYCIVICFFIWLKVVFYNILEKSLLVDRARSTDCLLMNITILCGKTIIGKLRMRILCKLILLYFAVVV